MSVPFKKIITEKEHGFTLIELIIVIIIVGILAAVGISQYSATVEKSRLAEAKTRIGTMRQLAYQYYLENGSLDGIQYSDVGVDNTCASAGFYRYSIGFNSTTAYLIAARCTSDGKTPNVSKGYHYSLTYEPGTGWQQWHCYYDDDGSGCFGLMP